MRSGVMNRQPFGGRYAPFAGDLLTAVSVSPKVMTPPGAEVGDLLIACIRWENVSAMTPASGWTLISEAVMNANTHTIGTYWRVHGSESLQEVFTIGSSITWATMMVVCKHIDRINPIISVVKVEDITSDTPTWPAVTPGEKAVLVGVIGTVGGRHIVNPPPAWSRLSRGAASTVSVVSKNTTVGPQATPTFTGLLSAVAIHSLQTIALRPAS